MVEAPLRPGGPRCQGGGGPRLLPGSPPSGRATGGVMQVAEGPRATEPPAVGLGRFSQTGGTHRFLGAPASGAEPGLYRQRARCPPAGACQRWRKQRVGLSRS